MDDQLEILSDTFNKCEPIFQKAGLTYELAVRCEVRELRGIHMLVHFGMLFLQDWQEFHLLKIPVIDWFEVVIFVFRI